MKVLVVIVRPVSDKSESNIKSGVVSDNYRNNHERIFGKSKWDTVPETQRPGNFNVN